MRLLHGWREGVLLGRPVLGSALDCSWLSIMPNLRVLDDEASFEFVGHRQAVLRGGDIAS